MVDVLEHYAKQNGSEEVHAVVKTAVIVKGRDGLPHRSLEVLFESGHKVHNVLLRTGRNRW